MRKKFITALIVMLASVASWAQTLGEQRLQTEVFKQPTWWQLSQEEKNTARAMTWHDYTGCDTIYAWNSVTEGYAEYQSFLGVDSILIVTLKNGNEAAYRLKCKNRNIAGDCKKHKELVPKGGDPCEPDTCVLWESYNNYKEKIVEVHDTVTEKVKVRPFVEQLVVREIGEYSYTNGPVDAPTYVGVYLLDPRKNTQLMGSVGYRGTAQQRFGQLAGDDCHCHQGEAVWTLRLQAAYNFKVTNSSFIQAGIQYEHLLSGAKLERDYPGLNLSQNWRPYGSSMLSLKLGHDWSVKDKNLGGAIIRATAGPSYDARHGFAVEASVSMVFVGKKNLPAPQPPDAVEKWINDAPGKTWTATKGFFEKLKDRREERDSLKQIHRDSVKALEDSIFVKPFLSSHHPDSLINVLGMDSVSLPNISLQPSSKLEKKLAEVQYDAWVETLNYYDLLLRVNNGENAESELASCIRKLEKVSKEYQRLQVKKAKHNKKKGKSGTEKSSGSLGLVPWLKWKITDTVISIVKIG